MATARQRFRRCRRNVIDLHCHILPGIDDGPGCLAQSIELARAARAGGTSVVAATPHVSWEWQNRAEDIATAVADLNASMATIGIAVVTGAEIAMPYLSELGDTELEALTLGRGDTLLVECPLSHAAPPFEAIVFSLHRRGFRTLLAHPERSPAVRSKPGRLEALVRAGALTQITAGSLVGQFGREVKRFSYWMLEEGLVHNIASDAHDATRRSPKLESTLRAVAAWEAPGLADHLEWFVRDVPRAILDSAPVPRPPAASLVPPRGPVRRLRDRLRGTR